MAEDGRKSREAEPAEAERVAPKHDSRQSFEVVVGELGGEKGIATFPLLIIV